MIKKKKNVIVIVFCIFLNSQFILTGQGKLQDYQRAEKLLPENIVELVFDMRVMPQWIGEAGSSFWYRIQRRMGKVFMRVDPNEKRQFPAFDHTKLAESLSQELEKDIQPWDLPFNRFEYKNEERSILFTIDEDIWLCDLNTYVCTKYQEEKTENPSESRSPDGNWIAFIRDYNLFIRDAISGEEYPLSTDGINKYDYGTSLSWYRLVNVSDPEEETPQIYINWSPDSTMFVTQRLDRRREKNLYLFEMLLVIIFLEGPVESVSRQKFRQVADIFVRSVDNFVALEFGKGNAQTRGGLLKPLSAALAWILFFGQTVFAHLIRQDPFTDAQNLCRTRLDPLILIEGLADHPCFDRCHHLGQRSLIFI